MFLMARNIKYKTNNFKNPYKSLIVIEPPFCHYPAWQFRHWNYAAKVYLQERKLKDKNAPKI